MRKLFSFCAAMLVALAVSADTDFAAPGYSCAADDAALTGGSGNFTLNTELDPHQIQWSDVGLSSNALATWTIVATRGCYVSVSLDLGPVISSNKHIFEVKILDAKSNVRGTLAEPAENADADQVKVLDGTILIPAAGTYTVELRNNRDWGKGRIKNVILTYAADAPSEIIAVSAIELNKTELALQVEEVEQLIATVSPDNATDPTVSWESDDEAVATVVDGFITAKAAGTATIKAKAGEKEATCEVTVAAATVPDVDFASACVLSAKKAQLEGKIWKMYTSETYKLYGDGGSNKQYGNALWTINVTHPCIVSGVLNGVEGGHLFELDLYKGEEFVATIAHPADKAWSKGEIALEGTLTFATAGEYTLKLRNTQEWSSGKAAGITLTKSAELPQTLYLKPNDNWKTANAKFAIWDITHSAWSGFMTLAENETDIYTTTIPADAEKVIFVRLNPELEAPDWGEGKSWTQTGDLDLIENRDLFTINNDSWTDGEWSKYGAKFYISGSMTSWAPSIVSLADSYTFENLAAGNYSFKVIAPEGWFGYAQLTPASKAVELYPDQDDNVCFTLAAAGDVTVTYIKNEVFKVEGDFVLPEVTLQGIPDWDNPSLLVAATDKLSASVTVSLNANWGYELKIICGGTWLGKDANPKYELKREVTSVSGLTYTGDNMKLLTDKAGEYTFTWTYATRTLTVTYPDLDHENGFYLAGTFSGVEKWSVDAITADKQFVWYKKTGTGDNDEWKLSITVAEGDELKACYIYNDNITDENWFPGGVTPRYVVDAAHAGKVNIYLRPAGDGGEGWWYNTLYVEKDVPSAIDNTEAAVKAQKMIENDQIVILKNGVKYNVLGDMVR